MIHIQWKLACILPVLAALTSCSSVGNMQDMQVNSGISGKPVVQQHQQVVKKYHVKKHESQQQVHVKKPIIHSKKTTDVAVNGKKINYQKMVPTEKMIIKSEKPVTVSEVVAPVQVDDKSISPENNQVWLLAMTGLEVSPGAYKSLGKKTVPQNAKRLDKLDGKYHYIQAARWNGNQVEQIYINANTATLLSLIGLGVIQNGYLDTNYGPVIMLFGGNGYLLDMSGHQMQLELWKAGAGKGNKKASSVFPAQPVKAKPQKSKKPRKKKQSQHQHRPAFDPNDFYITGTSVLKVSSRSGHDEYVRTVARDQYCVNRSTQRF